RAGWRAPGRPAFGAVRSRAIGSRVSLPAGSGRRPQLPARGFRMRASRSRGIGAGSPTRGRRSTLPTRRCATRSPLQSRSCPRPARPERRGRERASWPDRAAAAGDPEPGAGAAARTPRAAPSPRTPDVSAALAVSAAPRTLARRLVPLQVAVALQGIILWVPVEKLFMTEIGFTARSVSVMAAAYAAVVPLLEVPSGILADRRSRSLIMVCASIALLASTLLGGLSTNVPTYIAAAMILGVYFALSSGTVDSIVYDVVLEETGSSAQYEAWI